MHQSLWYILSLNNSLDKKNLNAVITLESKMPLDTTKALLTHLHRFKYMGFDTNYSLVVFNRHGGTK